MLVLLFVALWYILRGDLFYVLPCVILFLCFSVLLTSRLPCFWEERANLSAFRKFVRFVLVWFCQFPLPLGVWEGLRFVIVALSGLFSYLFNVTNQCVNIQILLFLDISFDLLSQSLKLRSEFTTASLFCLCMSLIPFSLIPSNLRCNPMDESYTSTCLRGTILIYSLLYEGNCQIEVFLKRTRMTIEIFTLCKV